MQLKGVLLIGFVLNVFCLKNLSGKFLSPKYDILKTDLLSRHKNESLVESIKKDPTSFVELFAKAESGKINQVIGNKSLVESIKKDPSSFVELFAKAEPGKINQVIGILELLLTDASSTLDILESHVTDATNNLNTANSNLVIAHNNLQSADVFLEHSKAVIDQTNAALQKDDADQNYNEESPALINEQEVIREVIGILRSLIGNSSSSSSTASPTAPPTASPAHAEGVLATTDGSVNIWLIKLDENIEGKVCHATVTSTCEAVGLKTACHLTDSAYRNINSDCLSLPGGPNDRKGTVWLRNNYGEEGCSESGGSHYKCDIWGKTGGDINGPTFVVAEEHRDAGCGVCGIFDLQWCYHGGLVNGVGYAVCATDDLSWQL